MIPPIFYSVETERPFESCLRCDAYLLDGELPYSINKQFDRGECVMEFAMCHECKLEMHGEMSVESREAMANFFDEQSRLRHRSAALEGEPYETWMANCLICGNQPSKLEGYTIGAMGLGMHQLIDPYPLMICNGCQSQADQLLSAESRKKRDRFIKDHFPGPPTDLAPLPDRPAPITL